MKQKNTLLKQLTILLAAALLLSGCGSAQSGSTVKEEAPASSAAASEAAESSEAEEEEEAEPETDEAETDEADSEAAEEEDPTAFSPTISSIGEDGTTEMTGTYTYLLTPVARLSTESEPCAWVIRVSGGADQMTPIEIEANIDPDSVYFPRNGADMLYETDANFDGATDLLIYRGTLGTQGIYYFDCYLDMGGSFERCAGFEEIPNPVLDAETKTVSGSARDGATGYYEYVYQIDGTEAVKVSETEYRYDEAKQDYIKVR